MGTATRVLCKTAQVPLSTASHEQGLYSGAEVEEGTSAQPSLLNSAGTSRLLTSGVAGAPAIPQEPY